MIFITKEEELSFNQGMQVVYFYTSWAIFHQKTLLMIDRSEPKHQKHFSFLAVDVEQFQQSIKRFNLFTVPTVLIFRNGIEVRRIFGDGIIHTQDFENIFTEMYRDCPIAFI